MSKTPDKEWENQYVKDSTLKQRVELSNEEQEMKLNNSINLVKSLQNELRLESYSKELIRKGLSQISFDLECVKNGYMMV